MSGLLSNILRNQRFKAISPFLKGNVLDLGCGLAELIHWLAPGQEYVGVERNSGIIQYLREHYPTYEFHHLDLEIDQLDFGRRFDSILLLATLEHLKNPNVVLCQIPQLLSADGRLLITTPSPLGGWFHHLGTQWGIFSRYADEEHTAFLRMIDLEICLEKCGLEIIHYRKFLCGGNQLLVCTAKAE